MAAAQRQQVQPVEGCRMRVDDSSIDLHGWLRSFYSCKALGRSFVMDNSVQRPIPTYADFQYNRTNYVAILNEVLRPLGLKLVQGKVIDAIVLQPSRDVENSNSNSPTPSHISPSWGGVGGGRAPSSPFPAVPDSAVPDSVSVAVPEPVAPSLPPVRRLRAKAVGLLKSSARRLGFSHSNLSVNSSSELSKSLSNGVTVWGKSYNVSQVWEFASVASDSLGSLDFARIVDFSAGDTARVVFGGEIRRAESDINYADGNSVTKYASIFDGLTVDVLRDRWSFLWRRDGSILEVPGLLGSCASGVNNVSYESRQGVPFLDKIPGLRWFFSWEHKVNDELFIVVCLEELKDG